MMTDAMWNDADPVSPLSSPDEGTGTAVLERPETREQTDLTDDGDADCEDGGEYFHNYFSILFASMADNMVRQIPNTATAHMALFSLSEIRGSTMPATIPVKQSLDRS